MFNLIFVAIIQIIGWALLIISLKIDPSGETGIINLGLTILGVSVVWLLAAIVMAFNYYVCQQERYEKLRAEIKKLKILEIKSEQLIKEFKTYLGKNYKKYEKSIFEGISERVNSAKKLQLLLENYPELKTSESFSELARRMTHVLDKFYKTKLNIEDECAEIRYYSKSKWEIFRNKKIPQDLFDIVNSELPELAKLDVG